MLLENCSGLHVLCPSSVEYTQDKILQNLVKDGNIQRTWLHRDFNVFVDLDPLTQIFVYKEFEVNLLPKNLIALK